ncbi:MAG: hypothetical protein ACLRMJ_10400 [Alistipes finegoldii]
MLHDNPTPSPEPPVKGGEFNEFGFTTTAPVTLSVDYGDMAGSPANVYFEVYDTCPVEETESLCQNRRCRAALCRLYRRAGTFRRDDRTARVYPEGLCIDPRLLCAHPARSDPQRRYADASAESEHLPTQPRIDARQRSIIRRLSSGTVGRHGWAATTRPTAASATNTTAI